MFLYKTLIDLNGIEGDLAKERQRGTGTAEIIDGDQITVGVKRINEVLQDEDREFIGGLGDLDLDEMTGDAAVFYDLVNALDDARICKISSGKVYGDGRRIQPLRPPFGQVGADPLKNMQVQIADGTVLFHQGNKVDRRYDVAVVIPAGQGLGAAERMRLGVDLGLVVGHKVAVCQPLEDLVFKFSPVVHVV